ncbi:MAG TPA: hypothetical protein VJX74_00580 [Blastocatellia bacterium]|nr:hypothetical protein [Blastocatellia bacterium]
MAAISRDHENIAKRRTEIDREVDELRRSINATRTHGIFYYLLLVALFFVGFVIGYATHSLVGAGIIVIGLALLAWREVTGFRARTAVLNNVLGEKLAEQRHVEERQKELEIEQ